MATWAPFVGGAEVAAERLALGLQEAGHGVHLLLGQRGAVLERFSRAGLRCTVEPMCFTDKWRWWRHAASHQRIRKVLKRERPDVVHSNDLPTHQAVSAAARGLGIPRICHHRFIYGRAAIDWFNKFGAEQHVFVSHSLMDEMCHESARLAAAPRCVVHDGIPIPPTPTPADRRRARLQLGLPLEKVIVTFAGQIIECKGVAELLRAWAHMSAQWQERADLVIVGEDLQAEGAYRREMQVLAEYLGVPARFVGFQGNVSEWLLASDIAVVPSHVEPLGLVTLEAMVQCLPVIGSAVGGLCETIVPEETGLLVPPRDPAALAAAIEGLLADAQLRERLGESGRVHCQRNFSLSVHSDAIVDVYRELLNEAHKSFARPATPLT